MTTLRDRLAVVEERIVSACRRAGRERSSVRLMAVSKTHPAEAIREAAEAGLTLFGENRVQEFESKQPKLADLLDATWHLIGHLQSNKARRAVHLFHQADSIDSLSLAQRLDSAAAAESKRLPVLIEMNLGGEATKSGAAEGDLHALAEGIEKMSHLELRGLMTIPPYSDDPDAARSYFRKLRKVRKALSEQLGRTLLTLSMGMSHDFEVAIEEGATEIRIGTALFGERDQRV
ncbi:MAG TPA: YggS family pyridoxal phosphate-dependent enzyme [Verrucomicrobiae bacterium]|nr:YggS family pyridoxal phosphate-dependent enzyme [Verrucomicrobiae bacterium]